MKRVLVVDDEAEFREFIVRFARGLGFEATAVGSGAEFRAVYDEIAPDVIVLDIVMPDEDGLELLSWLGAKGCAARVLIVTGYNPHYRETAEVLGGARGLDVVTLQKPLALDDLEAALGQVRDFTGGPLGRPERVGKGICPKRKEENRHELPQIGAKRP